VLVSAAQSQQFDLILNTNGRKTKEPGDWNIQSRPTTGEKKKAFSVMQRYYSDLQK
jgi:hypothetical protein